MECRCVLFRACVVHSVGYLALQHRTESIRTNIRNGYTWARLGGEELSIVMPDTRETFAVRIADRLRQRVADTAMVLPDGRSLSVTVSSGCAMRGAPDVDTVEARMAHDEAARNPPEHADRTRDQKAANAQAAEQRERRGEGGDKGRSE